MLSIVTITFNNLDELVQTCKSLSGVECEHIVINGGDCLESKSFLENDFDGIFVSEKDNGISDAFNKGIKKATGKYISFLNSGDLLIDRTFYMTALEILESNTSYLGVSTKIKIATKNSSYIREAFNPLPNCPFNHPGFVFRTKDLTGLYFQEEFKVAMDFDLFIRLTELDFSKVALCENVAIEMIGGGVSQIRKDLGAYEKIKSLESLDLLRGKLRYQLYWQLFKGKIKNIIK